MVARRISPNVLPTALCRTAHWNEGRQYPPPTLLWIGRWTPRLFVDGRLANLIATSRVNPPDIHQ